MGTKCTTRDRIKKKLSDMSNTQDLKESTRSALNMVLLSVERGFQEQNKKLET